MRIGETLVARGLITRPQLDHALDEQSRTGALLGEVLVGLRYVDEEQVSRVLADAAGVAFAGAEPLVPDLAAVSLVPEAFARRHVLAPVGVEGSTIRVLQANPFDVLAVDELQRTTGRSIEPACATRATILRLLDRAYSGSGELNERVRAALKAFDLPPSDSAPAGAPVVRLIDFLLNEAVRRGATDLHIEPEERVIRLRYRIDGMLNGGDTMPKELLPPLVSRLKVIAGLDIAEQRLPQDGRITHLVDGRQIDLRVSTFPTLFGEKVAIRVLEKDKLIRGLEELGLSRRNLALLHDVLSKSRGMVLVTGPTGAGKTTTLYSSLAYLGTHVKNILTVEDPVEYEIPSIRQMQVRSKAGLTFATGIRAVLRQDPDVIMVGEIRDPETAQLAVRAALSGVLVFSTLHTQDSAGAVPRLMDMGLEPYLLASAVVAVVAQRLLRVTCPECKEAVTYPPQTLAKVGLEASQNITFVRGRGCAACGGTGYRGRTGAFELMAVDGGIHELIRQRADSRRIKESAIRSGMKTLLDDALAKAIFGQTTLDEVLRIAYE